MEGNSCGLGRFIQSLRQRAGSRSDMMMCQGNLMHLHGSSEALEQQWPPFMGGGGGGGYKGKLKKHSQELRGCREEARLFVIKDTACTKDNSF